LGWANHRWLFTVRNSSITILPKLPFLFFDDKLKTHAQSLEQSFLHSMGVWWGESPVVEVVGQETARSFEETQKSFHELLLQDALSALKYPEDVSNKEENVIPNIYEATISHPYL
jgi:hypothetical protein